MLNNLMAKIKQQPVLWGSLQRVYWTTKGLTNILWGSALNQRKWAQLSDPAWIKECWESRKAPHRSLILDAVKKYGGFQNILEIGCNCGPNLFNLAKLYPKVAVSGMDINVATIRSGRTFLQQEGCDFVQLIDGGLGDLKSLPAKSYDIVFVDAVLIYSGPLQIKKIIKEIVRITRKAAIFIEWHQQRREKWFKDFFYRGFWVRDYEFYLRQHTKIKKITTEKIPHDLWQADGWQKFGCVIRADMGEEGRDQNWKGTYPVWQNPLFCEIYARETSRQVQDVQGVYGLVSHRWPLRNTALQLYNPLTSAWISPVLTLAKKLNVARVWVYAASPIEELNNSFKNEFHTITIPLQEGEERLWKSVGDKTRNMVRKGKKAGVVVSLADKNEEFEEWWNVYQTLTKQKGFDAQSHALCKSLFEVPQLTKLFVARLDSKIIGGCFFLVDTYPLYWLGAFDRTYQNTAAGHVVMWEALLSFQSAGYPLLDLGGISVGEEDGPSRFKKSFGGEIQKGFIYEWPVSKFKDGVLRILKRVSALLGR